MPAFIDMTGIRFGWLVAVARKGVSSDGKAAWECKCDCGRLVIVNGRNLRSGNTKSCGCYKVHVNSDIHKIHGQSQIPYYQGWKSMMTRCHNQKSDNYLRYGAKGVFVCDFLRENPEHLLIVIGEKPTPKHTIDRYPNKIGSYTCGSCPSCIARGDALNVRWATRREQARNKVTNRILTHNGVSMLLKDWAKELGIAPCTLSNRIRFGLDLFAPKGCA